MKIIDIAEVFVGRPPHRVEDGAATATVPIVAMRDISLRIAPRDRLEEVEVAGDPDPKRRLQPGDVVVTSRGRVRAAVAQDEHRGVLVGPNLMLVRPQADFPPGLLAAYLRHPLVEEQLLADMAGAATAGFSLEALRSLELQPQASARAQALAALVEETDAYREEVEAGAQRLSQAAAAAVFAQLAPTAAR